MRADDHTELQATGRLAQPPNRLRSARSNADTSGVTEISPSAAGRGVAPGPKAYATGMEVPPPQWAGQLRFVLGLGARRASGVIFLMPVVAMVPLTLWAWRDLWGRRR